MYQLMNADEVLITFEAKLTSQGYEYNILDSCNEEKKEQMPLIFQLMHVNDRSLTEWIGRRTVPVNRHHMEILLKELNLKNKFETLLYCKGLSLTDCFWIKEMQANDTFDKINLYDNKFDESLGWIAFTGLPSTVSKNLSTPELTTVGVLPKYWERRDGKIFLVKAGTYGYANAGREPLAEVISSIVARILSINSVPYKLGRRRKKVVSICELFTSKDFGMVTMNEIMVKEFPGRKHVTFKETIQKLHEIGLETKLIFDMIYFDALVRNADRHLNNFSYFRNNKTGKITDFATLWDTGECLDSKKMDKDPKDYYIEDTIFSAYDIPYTAIFEMMDTEKYISKTNIIKKSLNSGQFKELCLIECGTENEKRIDICCDILKARCDFIEQKL